jgi:hypothetical protein
MCIFKVLPRDPDLAEWTTSVVFLFTPGSNRNLVQEFQALTVSGSLPDTLRQPFRAVCTPCNSEAPCSNHPAIP